MAKEYIERKRAIVDACNSLELYPSEYAELENALNRIPAADVAPLRHAKWVDNHCTACGMMPMGDEMWKRCDFEPPLFERFMDYCPNCGAYMMGENNGKCE